MWGRLVEQVRRVGVWKIVIFIIAAAVAVALAYGNNSTNDVADGRTLPRVLVVHLPTATAPAATRAIR